MILMGLKLKNIYFLDFLWGGANFGLWGLPLPPPLIFLPANHSLSWRQDRWRQADDWPTRGDGGRLKPWVVAWGHGSKPRGWFEATRTDRGLWRSPEVVWSSQVASQVTDLLPATGYLEVVISTAPCWIRSQQPKLSTLSTRSKRKCTDEWKVSWGIVRWRHCAMQER